MKCKKPIKKQSFNYFTLYHGFVYDDKENIVGEIDASYYDNVFKHYKDGKIYQLESTYNDKYVIVGEIN